MTLRERRVKFTQLLAQLLAYAPTLGIEVTIDEVYRPPALAKFYAQTGKGIANSLHCDGCAADVNAYRDHDYLTQTEDYAALGAYWKGLDPMCRWGGDFTHRPDGRHFSLSDDGVRA